MLAVAKDEGYINYYKQKLEQGQEYQDFVMDKLHDSIGWSLNCYSSRKYQYEKGESRTGIEIKFDNLIKKKGNLYIEYAEKSNPNNKNYVPSGIERNDNTIIYCIGNYEVIYLIAKNWLQQFKLLKNTRHVTTATSKGYLFSEIDAKKYAIKIIKC